MSYKVEGVSPMGDKDFKDCLDKLVEATNRLDATVEKMGSTIDKMIDYCTVITLVMFITIVIAFIF